MTMIKRDIVSVTHDRGDTGGINNVNTLALLSATPTSTIDLATATASWLAWSPVLFTVYIDYFKYNLLCQFRTRATMLIIGTFEW